MLHIQSTLKKIISNPSTHSKFLNTLSFLEYIGARKILKSLDASFFDQELLGHAIEEMHHSLFFKKLSEKVEGTNKGFESDSLISHASLEKYFQNIDDKAKKYSKDNVYLNYLYTTLMIETRALNFYEIYNKLLTESDLKFTLGSVLKDEKKHLEEVEKELINKDPKFKQTQTDLLNFEDEEFKKAWSSLEKSLN